MTNENESLLYRHISAQTTIIKTTIPLTSRLYDEGSEFNKFLTSIGDDKIVKKPLAIDTAQVVSTFVPFVLIGIESDFWSIKEDTIIIIIIIIILLETYRTTCET